MKRVALKTNKMNPEQLIIHARNVQEGLTTNVAIFATPPFSMADLQSEIDALEIAQMNTYNGGKAARVIRDQKRLAMEDRLLELSWYVNGISRGDEATMNLAGMVAAVRGPRRYDTIATPKGLSGFSPYTGAVKLRWEKISNAKTYAVEYCPDPITGTEWKNGFYNSGANAEMGGFESGKKYWFRVRALGSAGMMSDWSDPICILIS
jgi:hypothetical protein